MKYLTLLAKPLRKFNGTRSKCSYWSVTSKPCKHFIVVTTHDTIMSNDMFGTHSSRQGEIPECFIVSTVAKDCLVLSQHELHHGIFQLVMHQSQLSQNRDINEYFTKTHCKDQLLVSQC